MADHKEKPRDQAEEMARGVVNLFTVERDTSLADGAGAPGSTSVGEETHVERDTDGSNRSATPGKGPR
jgi:hypothetical protein